jgi:putative ABC transport system ATP-binding protein
VAKCAEVVKTYRTPTSEVRALAGVSATFPPAALTAVVGPSGSGKSTLLHLLGGMDRPTSGSVEVQGVAVERASGARLRHLRRREVGFVFQRPSDNFLPYLTVGEHLRLSARRAARPPLIEPEALLRSLGMVRRIDHRPDALSGGEQQRAAFAQIILSGADMILADEPTAELDSVSAEGLLETIRQVVDAGVAFVVATHDPALRRIADQILELEHGRPRTRRPRPAPPAPWFGGSRSPFARPGSDPLGGGDSRPGRAGPASPGAGSSFARAGPAAAAAAAVEPEDPEEVLVAIEDIRKSYPRGTEVVRALRGVAFVLPPGQIVGLVGRSGSGKTTILNVIGGWEQPDSGRVTWGDGTPVGAAPSWAAVGVLPQRFGLMDELSVRANIEYPARLAGRLDELGERVDELLEVLGLDQLQTRSPRETSVGEQQRTALARALVLAPRLLLADEPTGHQDGSWGEAVLAALHRAASEGTCCLVATHDQEVARSFDRVLSVADGILAPEGPNSGRA